MAGVRRILAFALTGALAVGCGQPILDDGARLELLIERYIGAQDSESRAPRDMCAAAFVGRIAASRVLLAQLRDVSIDALSPPSASTVLA